MPELLRRERHYSVTSILNGKCMVMPKASSYKVGDKKRMGQIARCYIRQLGSPGIRISPRLSV